MYPIKIFFKPDFKLCRSGSRKIYISAIADKLISAHDGDVALLYIYLQRAGSDLDGAARELCRTMSEIEAAHEKLQRMGLMPDGAEPANAAPPAQSTGCEGEKLPRRTRYRSTARRI